jgi:hypothetical protein
MRTILKFNFLGALAFIVTSTMVKHFGTGENVVTIAMASGQIVFWMISVIGFVLNHLKK